jgi:hypothetical protein
MGASLTRWRPQQQVRIIGTDGKETRHHRTGRGCQRAESRRVRPSFMPSRRSSGLYVRGHGCALIDSTLAQEDLLARAMLPGGQDCL